MILEIPEDLITKQLVGEVVSVTLREIDKRLSMITRTLELPPYASKAELMEILGIGDDKINYWISLGLPYQDWSKHGSEKTQYKFERETLQEFLRTLEVAA